MKASNQNTGHNRNINFSRLPEDANLPDLIVRLQYNYNDDNRDGAVIDKAVTLDKYVIPTIIRRVNAQPLLLRAAAALETPGDLSADDIKHLIEDLLEAAQ